MIISTRNLKKTYITREKGKKTEVQAVRGIDLGVRKGEVFGLLGPNGAGKTTTMQMLATLITPTDGKGSVGGFDVVEQRSAVRSKIGYVSQAGGMERLLTGRENIVLFARLYGFTKKEAEKRAGQLIQHLGLSNFADRKTDTYSGGQKRIFDLAAGIVNNPDIIFLDEPTTGLDPDARSKVWQEVARLQEAGATVFITTHYMEEANALCDRIAIMDKGEIAGEGSPEALKEQLGGEVITLGLTEAERTTAKEILSDAIGPGKIEEGDGGLQIMVDDGTATLPHIVKLLADKDVSTRSIELNAPTLDDVFLQLTGHKLNPKSE